jgi:hypothetical protein
MIGKLAASAGLMTSGISESPDELMSKENQAKYTPTTRGEI